MVRYILHSVKKIFIIEEINQKRLWVINGIFYLFFLGGIFFTLSYQLMLYLLALLNEMQKQFLGYMSMTCALKCQV